MNQFHVNVFSLKTSGRFSPFRYHLFNSFMGINPSILDILKSFFHLLFKMQFCHDFIERIIVRQFLYVTNNISF